MAQDLKWDVNKNMSYKVVCSRCDRSTNHRVLTSVENTWGDHEVAIYGTDRFEVIQCSGCDLISFRQISTNSEDGALDENGNDFYPEAESLYPSRIAGRKRLEHEYLLPFQVAKIYQETHGALCSNFHILTGVGIRALIESVCKEKNATGNNLASNIEELVKKSVLTPESAATLHKTRLLGNRLAHESVAPKAEELDVAMDIVENLLETVYVIPQRAKRLKIGTET